MRKKAAVIGLVDCAESAAVIGWIPRLLLQLVVRMQIPRSAAWFGGEDADPMLRVQEPWLPGLFVTTSHQKGLDTRSMTQRLIIVEIEGRGGRARAETRTLLDYAGHRLT